MKNLVSPPVYKLPLIIGRLQGSLPGNFSRLNKLSSLYLSLQDWCSRTLTIFIALLWSHSNNCMSFLCWRLQAVLLVGHHKDRVEGTFSSLCLLPPSCWCSPGYCYWSSRLQVLTAGSCLSFHPSEPPSPSGPPSRSLQGCSKGVLLPLCIHIKYIPSISTEISNRFLEDLVTFNLCSWWW